MVLELDGVRLVTDPVLRRLVGPLYRRVPRPLTEPLADPDVILISHLHLDHYDPRSLRLFRRDTPVLAPVGAGLSLRWRGFRDIYEIAPDERLKIGAVEVVGTAAKHRGTRHPLAARTPSLGYVISGSRSVYFAGDTGFFTGIADIWPERLDLAMLPIAGIGPLMPEFKHMSPRHAVKAMELLRPRPRDPHPLGHVSPAGHGAVPPGARLPPAGAVPLHGAGGGPRAGRTHRAAPTRRGAHAGGDARRARHAAHGVPVPQEPAGPAELAGPGVPGGIF